MIRNVVDQLLTNVYRSFDVRNESDVYDRLATSVTGDELTNVYLLNRQALEIENLGGARAHVDEVAVLDINSVEAIDNGFKTKMRWAVGGSVNHFGHTHYRKNQYLAIITVIKVEGNWKISNIEPIEEERII